MFRYEYPEFKNKQLLKADMLELLRDYSRQSAQLLFQGYGNGIMNGCELTWSDGWLTVNSGVIYRNGNLYFMDKPCRSGCRKDPAYAVSIRISRTIQQSMIRSISFMPRLPVHPVQR